MKRYIGIVLFACLVFSGCQKCNKSKAATSPNPVSTTELGKVSYKRFYVNDETHYLFKVPNRNVECVLSYGGDGFQCWKTDKASDNSPEAKFDLTDRADIDPFSGVKWGDEE